MDLLEAIKKRHSVRSYLKKALPADIIEILQKEISEYNRESGMNIQLITNEPKAFKGMASYGKFKGVENYIIIAGKKSAKLDEQTGYYGEHLVLLAQTLGLNTCWVGMTYKKVNGAFSLKDDEKISCAIALGYGETQGHSRKSKTIADVSNADANSPEWFIQGVRAALLAPTAMNQQKFRFTLTGSKTPAGKAIVEATRLFSIFGYTKMDLGIAKLHFELAAGKDNFDWK